MSAEKMTDWFPPEIKPVRRGTYEVNIHPQKSCWRTWRATWNGDYWLNEYAVLVVQDRYWRGLATNPERSKRAKA